MTERITFLLLSCLLALSAFSQDISNYRQRYIPVDADTVRIDTLSVIPGSVMVAGIDTACFLLRHEEALFIWNKSHPAYSLITSDSVLISYRVFPLHFTRVYFRRDPAVIEKKLSGFYHPEEYRKVTQGGLITRLEGLSKTGSISRGISFGNNQDLIVNSSLNLQLAGKLSQDVEIMAAVTDKSIPVQPQGNTRQINDFDKVFIRLSRGKSHLTAGDYELKLPDSYFMHLFNKKAQGGLFTTSFATGAHSTLKTSLAAALSKGRYARQVFNGMEGNQGPYKLRGAQNETFIVILSGTEKIFVDGVLMQRGQEYDYVIDYNTAELTFTSRVLITKDKRIVAEFEYSDKNYARTLLYLNNEWEDKKRKVRLNVYSEQDSRNQPLLQELSQQQKQFLSALGDNTDQAFFPAADSVPFNINEVLYERIDSAGFTFYRYSTDSTRARFRLTFTDVGPGRGNYVQVQSAANGRVFEWLPPVNGVPQGRYEPVRLLIAPRSQQLITLGISQNLGSSGNVQAEGAFSHYDQNTFSKKDKSNDAGAALHASAKNTFTLQPEKNDGWKLTAGLKGEYINRHFKGIENFRPVEFVRDWNLAGISAGEPEQAWAASLDVEKQKHRLGYSLQSFQRGSAFKGLMHTTAFSTGIKSLRLMSDGSLLNSSGSQSKSVFYKANSELSNRFFSAFTLGVRFNLENNRQYAPASDSLLPVSFSNQRYSLYLTNGDTGRWQYTADYSLRYDDAVNDNRFVKAVRADEIKTALTWIPDLNSRWALTTHYRWLNVLQPEQINLKEDRYLLGRLEYNGQFLQNAVTVNSFYEAGSGQEQKREITYIKVADGTGIFTWNDYSGDGIPQLNEFEVAAFKDQANYIRIFTPTQEYVRTRFNQLGWVTGLNPSNLSARKTVAGRLLSLFSDQFSFRTENRYFTDDLLLGMNPLATDIEDTLLITSTRSLRNTLYFNRTATVFGSDLTYDRQASKTLLSNGIESRTLQRLILNFRYNWSRSYGWQPLLETGKKTNRSEFFSERDYNLLIYAVSNRLHYQPGSRWRLTLLYEYKQKKNKELAGEFSRQHTAGTELKVSHVQKGIIVLKFQTIRIDFSGRENSPLSYEMLEGLNSGINYTWGLNIQRTLSGFLQLTLNYDGRRTEGGKAVHTATAELRAFF
jgi:hypothetical protein